MEDFSTTELIVGLASLFIFFYRLIFIMYPMLKDSIKRRDPGDALQAFTLLV
tara:strand:+ start:2388 stop:2543 length:156 start_codon:yes stop_codon:yes gene_type:complete